MAQSTSTGKAEILTIKQVAMYLQILERTISQRAAAVSTPALEVRGLGASAPPISVAWKRLASPSRAPLKTAAILAPGNFATWISRK